MCSCSCLLPSNHPPFCSEWTRDVEVECNGQRADEMSIVVGCVWSLDSSDGTNSRTDAASNNAIKKIKRKKKSFWNSRPILPCGNERSLTMVGENAEGDNGRRGSCDAAGLIPLCWFHIAAWLPCIYGDEWLNAHAFRRVYSPSRTRSYRMWPWPNSGIVYSENARC